ncbi:MAG: hypothetical protein GY772_30740 [bacterium]|nr:hypothetical protein [bacterium]
MGPVTAIQTQSMGNAFTNSMEHDAKKQKYKISCKVKMANVAPQFRGIGWQAMNEENMKLAKNKLQSGCVRRNSETKIGVDMVEISPAESGGASPAAPAATPAAPESRRGHPAGSGGVSPAAPASLTTAPMLPRRDFVVYTFGVQKLSKEYKRSKVAQRIYALTDVRGGPPIAVPDQEVSAP